MSRPLLVCTRRVLLSQRACGGSSSPMIDTILDGNDTLKARWYSATRYRMEEESDAATDNGKEEKAILRKAALEFGRRKASYKRSVSKLRREYMEEYQRYQAEDKAQRDAERAETTRRRLERQRAKNERSVQNAIRQEELRRQAHLAFQDHLQTEQAKRDETKKLFTRARQLLIDELEEEAPLWLTTPEQVEAAFTPEAEQLLWARPHGILGAPNPSLDSSFWQYECHTWNMDKTYKTQQDVLLETLEEQAYKDTNIDPKFWNAERLSEQESLERKARLRANVRMHGRKSLLARQREYLLEEETTEPGDIPKPKPIPSLSVLADVEAQEKEGVEALMKDPTQFFIFANDNDGRGGGKLDGGEEQTGQSYSGGSLGIPIGLKQDVGSAASIFPKGIGKLPKPDTRTEKEKKREAREQQLWAAAQAKSRSENDEIELAAEEDEFVGEPLDYDKLSDWDEDDDEWAKGLDPIKDADLFKIPKDQRYRQQDIDWVISQLEAKAARLQTHLRNSIVTAELEERSRMERREAAAAASSTGKAPKTSAGVDFDVGEDDDDDTETFFDADGIAKLESVGADVEKYETLLSSLTREQLLSVFALEGKKEDKKGAEMFGTIDGLTEEQIAGLAELEDRLLEAESREQPNLI